MDVIRRDLRLALRALGRTPGSTLVTILTLALGIGGVTLVFGIVQAVLLRPLPFADPDRLVQLWQVDPAQPAELRLVTPDNLGDWRAQARAFDQIAYLPDFAGARDANLAGRDGYERVAISYVSANFFATFGATPRLGRDFEPREDEQERHPPTAIVSHDFWRTHLDADPGALGRTLTLDTYWKRTFTIVGVMPPAFDEPRGTQIWLPMGQSEVGIAGSARAGRCCPWLQAIGRLKPGVTMAQAQREMDAIAERIARAHPQVDFGRAVKLVPLHDQRVGTSRPALLALSGASACVLLIACVNLAHLALARAAGRRQEVGVRVALGATRWQLVRELSAESLLLGMTGGLLGATLAAWGLRAAPLLLADHLPRADAIHTDTGVLAFSLSLSLLTTLIVGILPAWWSSQHRPQDALRQASRANTEAPGHARLRAALVIAQMACGLVLLAGALLLAQGLVRLLRVDPGFTTDRVLVLDLDLSSTAFDETVRPQDVFDRIRERLTARPDVQAVSGTLVTPLSTPATGWSTSITIEGEPFRSEAESPRVDRAAVMPDYFRTLGIPLKQGRWFTEDDRGDRPQVAIINEAMAARYWPGRSPLGQRFTTMSREELERMRLMSHARARPAWVEIVGIVGNARTRALDEPAHPAMFVPYRQFPWDSAQLIVRMKDGKAPLPNPLSQGEGLTFGDWAERSGADRVRAAEGTKISALLQGRGVWGEGLLHQIRAINPHIVVSRVRTMDEILSASIGRPRLGALVAGLFAAIGLALAALGLYGVMAHAVAARTREIGVRMALGARPADARRLVLVSGLKMAAAGLVLGLAGILLLTRVLGSVAAAIGPLDPVTLCAASAALAAVALLAALGPARRAAALDPIAAIRQD